MYAIVRTGNHQFKIAEGDVLRVPRLAGEIGDKVKLEEVLLVGDGEKVEMGKPLVKGASATCEIVAQARARKVISFKYRRRKSSKCKQGHRQPYTELKVLKLKG